MISASALPTWFHILRLLVTFFLCAGCGVHAYACFKTHLLVARRWLFWLYSMLFLMTALAIFVYLMIAVQMRDYSKGPFALGMFSVLLIFSYFTLTYGVGKRKLEWNEIGHDQIVF